MITLRSTHQMGIRPLLVMGCGNSQSRTWNFHSRTGLVLLYCQDFATASVIMVFDMPQWWSWRISLCSRLTVTVPTTSVHTPVLTVTISYTGCLLPYPVSSGHQQNRENAGWSMLAACDKRDGQMFVGWQRRPTSFGRMLSMSKSHESMQGRV